MQLLQNKLDDGYPNGHEKTLSPQKMKAGCGSDAYVAISANIYSRDVGDAPTKCVNGFHGKTGSQQILMNVRVPY